MVDPTFEKTDDGYRITDGTRIVIMTAENFEDLFFAVPVSPSQFYRLLTDSCCTEDADRVAIREMVEASELGMNAALDKMQAEVAALPEPETS